MFLRRLHWVLFAVAAIVAILRLLDGNLLGGLLAGVLAALFASIAADYPLARRAREVWRWLRRLV